MDNFTPRVGVYRERPGSDIVKQGYLKKIKSHALQKMSKKYFVLRSTSSSGPARLDYYDTEKKFKSSHPPKKSIPLHTCFNINKRVDCKHKFGISVFLGTECFAMVAESEPDQEDWLGLLLKFQNEYLLDGEAPKQHYEYVWQGVVKKRSATSCTKIEGPYRLCLSNKEVSLIEMKQYHPAYTFQFASIRRCGHQDSFFFMEVGRSAVTGSGEIWMQMEETHTPKAMHDAVLAEMAAARSDFRVRSNTSTSVMSNSGEMVRPRQRATSESHHHHSGSPRRNRSMVSNQRPSSAIAAYSGRQAPPPFTVDSHSQISINSSGFDSYDTEMRLRTDSMGSHCSRTSRHSDMNYENTAPSTPVAMDEFFNRSSRSQTPEAPPYMIEEDTDGNIGTPSFYQGQRSTTPSPTRGQFHMDRSGYGSDLSHMISGQRSGTPSPTRHMERPASANSEGHDSVGQSEGYMDMRPGSMMNSPASQHESYMVMTPPASSSASSNSAYMSMTPPLQNSTSGYIEMSPGQRTPTDSVPGPGYMVMDGGRSRMTAPIPIRPKDSSYMDMGTGCQPLPTVKESGSGEAYLPMSPTSQSPMSSEGLKPAKVVSYLSDDSMSGEFPKRAYSVGSRPAPKSSYRYHQHTEMLRRQPLDSSKSSSAPHLIVQKHRNVPPHMDTSYQSSSLSQSIKSDDCDSFMEMDFYRPRTASDSYGCRPRSSSFNKQLLQGHRPRSSSYGQGSKGNISKLAAGLRTDSLDSMRSNDLSGKRRSQESLGKISSSSRNSSSDSLKKLSEELHSKKNLLSSDYMDMGFDKRKTPSPNVQGMMSPQAEGYVDMTLGTSTPKSSSRGVSPSSSTHSLGSSPASVGHVHQEKSHSTTKVVKASGKQVQKPGYKNIVSITPENQLKVIPQRLKMTDKRSPSSSGKESEDESYVPFQPSYTSPKTEEPQSRSQMSNQEYSSKARQGSLKVYHGYSKSYDSGMKSPDMYITGHDLKAKTIERPKPKSDDEGKSEKNNKSKSKIEKERRKSMKEGSRSESKGKDTKSKPLSRSGSSAGNLQEMAMKGKSPTLDRKMDCIPDDDLFSNKMFQSNKSMEKSESFSEPEALTSTSNKMEESSYLEYDPSEGLKASVVSKTEATQESKSPERGIMGKSEGGTLPRKSLIQRDYCEIDPPKATENKMAESDYMEADPAPLKAVQNESPSRSLKNAHSEDFSYMDFDPAAEKRNEEQSDQVLRAPQRVQSFINIGQLDKELNKKESEKELTKENEKSEEKMEKSDMVKDDDNKASQSVQESGKKDCSDGKNCDDDGDSSTTERQCGKTCRETDDKDSGGSRSCGQKDGNCGEIKSVVKGETKSMKGETKSVKGEGKTVIPQKNKGRSKSDSVEAMTISNAQNQGHVQKVKDQGESVAVIEQNDLPNVFEDCDKEKVESRENPTQVKICSIDNTHGKLVIRSTVAVRGSDSQPVQDEGYCDLDFDRDAPAVPVRSHHRSGSTSSSNSDRSRRVFDCDDDIQGPETPLSYIQEDHTIPTPQPTVSYISDESLNTTSANLTSPVKPPLTGQNSLPSLGKDPGSNLQSIVQNSGDLQKSLPTKQSNNGGNNLSRQTSVPVAQCKSPRSSAELPTGGRCRMLSGPAAMSTVAKVSNGNGANQSVLPKCSAQSTLEPLVSGQELHKQKSMPCMTLPIGVEKTCKSNDYSQDIGQSRHSFPDLSQYEEMSFPNPALSQSSHMKSNSQTQLSDSNSKELHYADLDLKNSSENVDEKSLRVKSRHPSSVDDLTQDSVPYAQIDYLKTESMKQANEKDVKFTIQ